MGTRQPESRHLLIFGVNTLAQSIGLAKGFSASTANNSAWNLQGFQLISVHRVQKPILAPRFLDVEVMAPKTRHWEK